MATLRDILGMLRAGYRRFSRPREDERTREIVGTLQEIPAFQDFSRSALKRLADALHRRTYKRDEFLYFEGDPGLGLYIVQRGRVRLLVEDEQGAAHELRQVGEYEFFGEEPILGDFQRSETAQALTDTQVLGFFRPDLANLVKRHPRVGAGVLTVLARHLARQQAALLHLLAERDGRLGAMRLRHAATRLPEATPDPGVPAASRPS